MFQLTIQINRFIQLYDSVQTEIDELLSDRSIRVFRAVEEIENCLISVVSTRFEIEYGGVKA